MNRSAKWAASVVLAVAAVLASMASVASAAEPAGASTTRSRNPEAAFRRPAGLPASARLVSSPDPPTGRYYVQNLWTGRCLDAFYSDGGGNGNRVGLWDCNGGITEQWDLVHNSRADDFDMVLINNRPGRRVLDYPASSGGNVGYQFELWDPVGSPGQALWFFPRYDGVGGLPLSWEISVAIGGGSRVMDAYTSDGGVNGNRVGPWWITHHPAQRWLLWAV